MHKRPLTQLALLALLTTLGACATHTLETGPGTLTASARPAACIALQAISPSRGKPGGPSTEELGAALDKDHPVERVRNLVGDTAPTLAQIDRYNAALVSLCGEGANVSRVTR